MCSKTYFVHCKVTTCFRRGGIGKLIWVDMEGGGVKNGQKLATSFMDGPLSYQSVTWVVVLQHGISKRESKILLSLHFRNFLSNDDMMYNELIELVGLDKQPINYRSVHLLLTWFYPNSVQIKLRQKFKIFFLTFPACF